MTINTGGPIRGFIGRWVMRFEAAGQILSLGFQGTTAVSALSGVLAFTGYQSAVPYVLGAGSIAMFGFAWVYVEWGIFNRKNREKQGRGNNFSKPQNAIDDAIIARTILAADQGRTLTDDEREVVDKEALQGYYDFKDGVELPE